MRKCCITFLLSGIIMLTALLFGGVNQGKTGDFQAEYFRIHIRANSNDGKEQAVKYLVRDRVVEFLLPLVAKATSKEDAMSLLNGVLPEIEAEASAALKEEGFPYLARAEIKRERFPTRVYEGVSLPAGEYDALILSLGEGKGQNWWCVVYPPLCFTGAASENVRYKSLIFEQIERWKKGR